MRPYFLLFSLFIVQKVSCTVNNLDGVNGLIVVDIAARDHQ
jgi:UDP-N-acetylmuramyl pentapeptide phosphotransferase/UDP-N-acetylglucosamine-1-phosphate transferase